MQIQFITTDEDLQKFISLAVNKAFFELSCNLPTVTPTQETEQRFSITELANYLKCSKATIHAYKNRKVFPFYQTGRTVYFKKSEVDKALEVGNKKGAKAA